MDVLLNELLATAQGAGEFLTWGILYLIWNQTRMRSELEQWKADVEKRLTILETLNPKTKP